MANLGQYPELEEKLFCEDCRAGAHGQVMVYDHPEVTRLLELKEIKLEGRCVRCGGEHKPRSHKPHSEEKKEEAEFKQERSSGRG